MSDRAIRMDQYRRAHLFLIKVNVFASAITAMLWWVAYRTLDPKIIGLAGLFTVVLAHSVYKHYCAHTNYRLDRQGYLE